MQLAKLERTHVQARRHLRHVVDTKPSSLNNCGTPLVACQFGDAFMSPGCQGSTPLQLPTAASLLKPGIAFEDGSSCRLMNGIVDGHLFGAASSILDGSHVRPTESSTSSTSLDRESSSDLDAKGSWPRTFPYPRPPTFSIDFPLCRTTPPLSTPATAGGVTGRTGASS
jgi:hypothetical protein